MEAIKTKTLDFFQKLEEQKTEISIDFIDDITERKHSEEEISRRKADKKVINEGGLFEVQVHIQELRDLVGKDLSGSSDPVVTVTIMEQKKSTKKIEKQNNITLDQILFFSLQGLEARQLLKTKCLIQVFDHNVIFPNKIIGSFEFNLGSVYYKKNHEIYNQWVGLANNETKDMQDYASDSESDSDSDSVGNDKRTRNDGIQGSLKVSLCVLGANDEQYIHYDSDEEQSPNDGIILLPPSITQNPYKLTVKIYAYQDLAEMDKDTLAFMERIKHDMNYYNKKDRKLKMNSREFVNFFKALVPDKVSQESKEEKKLKAKNRLDPFFVVEFGGVRLRSSDYEDFGQFVGVSNDKVYVKFEIPVMEPTYCDHIQIEFWDKDNLADNDLISVIRTNYHRVKKQKRRKPRWYYMYGAPLGHEKNKVSKKMNRGFIEGTYFRGQSLIEMYVTAEQTKPPPIFDTFKVKDANIDYIDYELICDIYQGTEMYRLGKEMFIEISVCRQCKYILEKDMKIPEKGSKREAWDINKKLTLTIPDLSEDKNQWEDGSVPYIFVYICVGNVDKPDSIDCIAYNRVSIKDIIGNTEDGSPQWYDMREDPVLDKYPKNIFPGSLLIHFYCVEIGYNIPQSVSPVSVSLNETPKPRSKKKEKNKTGPAKMVIHHMSAMHLPQTDRWGTCDPCMEFRLAPKGYLDKRGQQQFIIKRTSVIHNTLDPSWSAWDQRIEFENVNIGDKLYVFIKDDDSVVDIMPQFEEVAKIKNSLTNNNFITLRKDEEKQGIGDWMELEVIKKSKDQKKREKLAQLQKGMNSQKLQKYYAYFDKPSVKFDIRYEYETKQDLEFLEMSMSIRQSRIEQQTSIEAQGLQSLQTSQIPKKKSMRLRADIYLGKNLRTTDLTSLCDPYLQVRFCGKTHKTQFVVDRSDPQWFKTLILCVEVPWPLKYAPSIYCEIYDKNFLNKDQPIGRFEEIAKSVYFEEQKLGETLTPKLYHLKDSENENRVDGEVLARFELTPDNENGFDNKLSIQEIKPPPLRLHSIHIIVLGLRDISSLLGVHECYIQFELGGKKYRSRKSNNPTSYNANYCEIIHFDVELPENVMFLPNLNIHVIDSLFGGLIERNIGYASIQVADLMWKEEQRIEFLTKQQETQRNLVLQNEEKKQFEQINNKSHDLSDSYEDEEEKELQKPLLQAQQKNGVTFTSLKINIASDSDDEDSDTAKLFVETPDFVYFKQIKDRKKSQKSLRNLKNKHTSKYMRIHDEIRPDFENELETKLAKEFGDYTLNPFLDIPLFSPDKHKRNIGNFKGLISFAPKRSKLLIIEIYEAKDLWKPDEDDVIGGGNLDPFIMVEFGGTRTKSDNIKAEFIDNVSADGILDDDFKIEIKFEIPIIEPVFADNILISVWDNNNLLFGDDQIGYLKYSYTNIKQMPNNEIKEQWCDLMHDTHDNPGHLFLRIKVKETGRVKKRQALKISSNDYQKSTNYSRNDIDKMLASPTGIEEEQSFVNSKKLNYDLGIETIREITKPQQLYLRLYVLNGLTMTPPDGGSKLNDPYLSIRIGEQKKSTKSTELFRKKILNDANEVSPDFYESFEFSIEMPGPSSLRIECWDHSVFGIKDSLIGTTVIDIEDRWYDKYWRDYLTLKPIETRTIKLHNMPHGKLKLWVEMLTVEQKKENPHMIDISQPAKEPYELRLIIWECNNIPVHDKTTSMNDLYCTAAFADGTHKQQTDLHFRSEASWQCFPGKGGLTTDGSFNWRMKFPINSLDKYINNIKKNAIDLQVWDKDYFSSDDYIGAVRIDLKKFLTFCQRFGSKKRCVYAEKEEQKIREETLQKRDGQRVRDVGSIKITMELVPNKLSEKYPAGLGRDQPNKNPYLSDPMGRTELSLFHPFRSLRLLMGKRLYLKMCLCLFCTFVIVFFVMMFPNLFSAFIADSIAG